MRRVSVWWRYLTFGRERTRGLATAAAVACLFVALVSPRAHAQLVDVAFDDFEGLTMEPFTLDYSSPYFLDGTDWSKAFPTDVTGATWTLDNSGNLYDNSTMPGEFDGWSMMDVSSWIAHAGVQAGRDRCYFGNPDRNVALVADPDEADDGGNADLGSPTSPLYNSYISVQVDLTGADLNSLSLGFDYDFVCEDTQTGVVDISFDNGATFENILTIDSTVDSGVFSTAEGAQGTFVAGTDFTAPVSASSVIIRFGCINASNDWWFCVDNVEIADTNGVVFFEDFERDPTLADQPFDAVNDGPTEPFNPSDGTDWTRNIPEWTVLYDGTVDFPTKKMYRRSQEGAYDGFAAVDSQSWLEEQDGQQREFFPGLSARNTILLFDGDAADDNLVPLDDGDPGVPEGESKFNTFVQREYDMSGYDNGTLQISFLWETRLYATQRALAQVSYDYGQTWETILDVDSSRLDLLADGTPEEPDYEFSLFPYLYFDNNSNGYVDEDGEDLLTTFAGPQQFVASAELPVINSNQIILRFGCIDTGNDWWFAVDDVLLRAEEQAFVMGDGDGDGDVDFIDLNSFANVLFGATGYNPVFDFDQDLDVDFIDLNYFANELFNF